MSIQHVQKKIEDLIFNFIDDDLKSIQCLNVPSRTVVYNEVVDLVENKILPIIESYVNYEEFDDNY